MACLDVENPWGLVIIASAFWIQFMAFGMATSFGVYIVELLHHFDVSLAFISLIGSINVGIFLGAGQWSMSPKLFFPLEIEAIPSLYMYRSNVKGGFICNFRLNLRVFRFKSVNRKPLQTFKVKNNPALIILLLMAHLSMCRSPGQHPDEEDVVPPSLFPGGRTQHLWPHCPALYHEHDLPSLLLWHCHRSVMNGVWSKNFNSETEVNSGTLN